MSRCAGEMGRWGDGEDLEDEEDGEEITYT